MNVKTKYFLALSALVSALAQWQPVCRAQSSAKPADIFPDPILATGKGFQIHRSQLEDAFLDESAKYAVRNGAPIPEEEREVVRSNLLQDLIIRGILAQKATAQDRAEVTAQVEKDIAEMRHTAGSQAAFEEQIKASGMTLEQMRTRACERLVCWRVMERDTTNGISVSTAEARKYYDENSTNFDEPEQVRVSHILISTIDPETHRAMAPDQKKIKEKLAKDIRAKVQAGEDFGKLVKQYSDDPGSKDKGGEYKFPRNQMVPEFEAAAFSLKTNQVSELVETQYGYHIIKLLEKFPARHEPFAEVEPKIRQYLVEKKGMEARPAYFDKLKAEAGVKLVQN